MSEEYAFRVILLFLFIAFVVVWVRNLISVGASRHVWYDSTEGPAIAIPIRLLLLASIVGIVTYLTQPARMNWAAAGFPACLRWVGLFLGITGLGLFTWVLQTLGRNFSTSLAVKKQQTLITHGPYRWVRHPMYTAFIILWVSFCLLSANWFIGLTGLAAYGLTVIVRTPKEEKMMLEVFGMEYKNYMARTGRYLPPWSWSRKKKGQ